jgi:hypothetical protein
MAVVGTLVAAFEQVDSRTLVLARTEGRDGSTAPCRGREGDRAKA